MAAERIKILFVITDLELGGSPLMVRDLALGLQAHGDFEPVVVSLKPLRTGTAGGAEIAEKLRLAGIRVFSLNADHTRALPRAVFQLMRLINDNRIDVLYSILIHANLVSTLATALIRKRPRFVQSIHTLQREPAWHWSVQGMIAQFADAIVVPARPILDRMAMFGPFTQGIVIPNGIDVDRFANAIPFPPDTLPWPAGSRVIGYVGRFDRVKSLPLLIDAFAILKRNSPPDDPPTVLALVGYGPEEEALRKYAVNAGVATQTYFVGPTREPERWYKTFTCHASPSSVEGFGLTLVESMAANVSVVATYTPVAGAILRDGVDGRLVNAPTASTLAKALQEVMFEWGGRPRGKEIIERARKLFSMEGMVEAHEHFLKKMFE